MRFLIVRLGALGDIIHAVPAAAALRAAHPDAVIDWLVDARHREFLDLVTVIDRVVVLEKSSLSGWIDVTRRLRAGALRCGPGPAGAAQVRCPRAGVRRRTRPWLFDFSPAREDGAPFLFGLGGCRRRPCHPEEPAAARGTRYQRQRGTVPAGDDRFGCGRRGRTRRRQVRLSRSSIRVPPGRTSGGTPTDSARSPPSFVTFAASRRSCCGGPAKRSWRNRSSSARPARRAWRPRPRWRIWLHCVAAPR